MAIAIGVDIGQGRKPSAACVAESERRTEDTGRKAIHFVVRRLERLPLGTTLPAVAGRVAELATGIKEKTGHSPKVFVNATGIGQPIIKLIAEERLKAVACYFTHGDRLIEKGREELTIGKAFLVSTVKSLLQTERLHLPKTPQTTVLADDLVNFEVRLDDTANDRPGAFPVGVYDDLVTALGLAVFNEPPPPRRSQSIVIESWG